LLIKLLTFLQTIKSCWSSFVPQRSCVNGDTSCPDHIIQAYLLRGVNVGLSETEVFHCPDLF